jgi:hypothetical protein
LVRSVHLIYLFEQRAIGRRSNAEAVYELLAGRNGALPVGLRKQSHKRESLIRAVPFSIDMAILWFPVTQANNACRTAVGRAKSR